MQRQQKISGKYEFAGMAVSHISRMYLEDDTQLHSLCSVTGLLCPCSYVHNEIEAARLYDRVALQLYGLAHLNECNLPEDAKALLGLPSYYDPHTMQDSPETASALAILNDVSGLPRGPPVLALQDAADRRQQHHGALGGGGVDPAEWQHVGGGASGGAVAPGVSETLSRQ